MFKFCLCELHFFFFFFFFILMGKIGGKKHILLCDKTLEKFLQLVSFVSYILNTNKGWERDLKYQNISKTLHKIGLKKSVNLFNIFAAKSLQSCSTLCDPIDGSPPGSPVPGILQARTLEWVAISFSNAWKWKVKVKSLSHVQLLVTPWTAAYQAPPSMGFSRQEYWSGVPLLSPTYLLR